MSRASVLLRLQQVDDHIASLRSEISTVDASIKGDPELDRLRAAEAAAEAAQRTSAARAEAAEREAATLQTRTRELDRRLYGGSVRNPAELMEMQRELEALRGRLSSAEDDALERMEEVDATQEAVRKASSDVAAREAKRSDAMAPLHARFEKLSGELESAGAERAGLRAEAEPADLSLYERVASHRRPAVAGVVDDACGGCHIPLSNEERRAVRTGTGLTQCPNCDRILAP